MFGTADVVAYAPAERILEVVDFKYGYGNVSVRRNAQLRFYALGAFLSIEGCEPRKIISTIIQPRVMVGEKIKHETFSLEELKVFGYDVARAAELTYSPNPPFSRGSHCRYCPAKYQGCPLWQ